jgi:hypothetical protein
MKDFSDAAHTNTANSNKVDNFNRMGRDAHGVFSLLVKYDTTYLFGSKLSTTCASFRE